MKADLALPAGIRLFHIGIPKTGTTALQQTAARRKDELLARGVRYPVSGGVNHRREVAAFMGRRDNTGEVPDRRLWDDLLETVRSDADNRVWIDHEWASESTDAMAAAFCEAIGGPLHIVVTLRQFGAVVASRWQQYMKHGLVMGLDPWLEAVLADPPRTEVTPDFHLCNDQGGVVTRWVSQLGPENVTVIITDKAQPDLMSDSFEDLLALPRGFLRDDGLDGYTVNRSMSLQEAELIRSVNAALPHHANERQYSRYVRNGAASHLLRTRNPGERDVRIELPAWAIERTTEIGRSHADVIAASGVRVIGDLDLLRAAARSEQAPAPEPLDIPVDIATTAVLGAIDAGQRYEIVLRERARVAADTAAEKIDELTRELRDMKAKGPTVSSLRSRGLAAEIMRRAVRGLGRRRP